MNLALLYIGSSDLGIEFMLQSNRICFHRMVYPFGTSFSSAFNHAMSELNDWV